MNAIKTNAGKMIALTAAQINVPTLATATPQNIVHLYKGNPLTDSLIIAREFGRRHDNVLQSLDILIKEGSIGLLQFKESSYINAQGKSHRMIELTERGALTAMPFIGGKKSRQGQARLVDAFLALRDELVAQSVTWADSRQAVSVSFRAVMEALKETRTDAGKETLACHYTNEARLINLVLFGIADGVDRASLSGADLKALEQVEAKNAYLIARGRSYPERKVALQTLAEKVRGTLASKIITSSRHAAIRIEGVAI
jgi:Rha family phage regulatory protein